MPEFFYTYILECADSTLYTGWTTDLDNRISIHNQGKGAKYTRSRLPVRILASWKFDSRNEAMSFEFKLKTLSRKQKMTLISERTLTPDKTALGP